jgi:Alanine dehydrogenase/PNT, C-terminal domain
VYCVWCLWCGAVSVVCCIGQLLCGSCYRTTYQTYLPIPLILNCYCTLPPSPSLPPSLPPPQATAMAKWVAESDIIITTALIPGRPAPKLISSSMLKGMKPGSGMDRTVRAVWCVVVQYVLCGVVWWSAVWCGVVWCGVVWCGGVLRRVGQYSVV